MVVDTREEARRSRPVPTGPNRGRFLEID